MKRRDFLKSLGAIGLTPVLPSISLSKAVAATPIIASETYNWAAMIARAHNSCSPAMLQRHLGINRATAEVLKNQLIQNGIITANANTYGAHKAVSPLFEDAFIKPTTIGKSHSSKHKDELPEFHYVALGGGAMLPMHNSEMASV